MPLSSLEGNSSHRLLFKPHAFFKKDTEIILKFHLLYSMCQSKLFGNTKLFCMRVCICQFFEIGKVKKQKQLWFYEKLSCGRVENCVHLIWHWVRLWDFSRSSKFLWSKCTYTRWIDPSKKCAHCWNSAQIKEFGACTKGTNPDSLPDQIGTNVLSYSIYSISENPDVSVSWSCQPRGIDISLESLTWFLSITFYTIQNQDGVEFLSHGFLFMRTE